MGYPEEQIKAHAGFKKGQQRPRVFSSSELFGDQSEIMIRHKNEVYRVRITRNGKLIMNK